jgi:aminoglycoside 6'-N-acetyltransferase
VNIIFDTFTENHFPLLLKWLEAPHVKTWWDSQLEWTLELIQKKYEPYLNSSNLMNAYIFSVESKPIGYIQYYNKHDFPREHDYAMELPESCAAIDWYIGEPEFVRRGIGTKALKLFLDIHVFSNFDNVFVDPDTPNVSAIRVYEKIGFITISKTNDDKVTLMLKTKI